ncbi:signal peptidase I [Pseudarthrobacter sp. AL07]|uniref:signal peptidase I n=1 Tax=unclassified Pseudarthrobacter TaxID=2647000 RepID=UPI00249A05EA|nr:MULTISPECIES: signal peptidase I [unclassified Pseudarthrobacter]MDI3193751.1 signal peptidase I [Pseudarthrobacter sp. AL20]MDI3207739.1 signal peptidase I [Pseudarthrobacter sp. AL07]
MTNRLARSLSAVFLTLAAGLLALVGTALASGQLAVVVTEGVSMQPAYYEGDLVIVSKARSYSVGDIAAYKLSNEYDVALHRIIGGDSKSFTFKGDNNESVDPMRPGVEDLVGRAVLHIPHAGTWLKILTSPPVLGAIAFALIAGGGSAATSRNRRRNRRTTVSRHISDRPAKLPSGASLPMGNLPGPLRLAAAGTAVVGILGASLAALAWAGPLEQSSSAEVKNGTSMTFSYAADVGQSAAYDGTTVSSPDPVFRKLANTVEVDFAYEGDPGTVEVAAELTSPSGWRSTVPLAGPQPVTGDSYEGTVTLDLKSFQAKADAAAAVTGLSAAPVAIAVVPQVTTETGAEFKPKLQLSMTPLQLSLTGGEQALSVTDSATTQQTVMAPRTLGFNGWNISAATARGLSAVLLLTALIAALVVVIMARRSTPVDEATGIRRRYSSLLVRVHPMTAPQGRPVIDVTSFATLAKLAERYGLLVLHWTRSGVETFIVQDESTTYRYRAGAAITAPAENVSDGLDLAAAHPASPADRNS